PNGDDLLDSDSDGAPDACDLCPGFDDNIDTDGDGVPDDCDACPNGDDLMDTDGDGVPDDCDICPIGSDFLDADGDTVPDACDLCPGFDDRIDLNVNFIPDGCETNSPPTVVNPGPLTVANNSQITTTIRATDPDGDPLTFSLSTIPQYGAIQLTTTTGALIYTPNSGFVGMDSFVLVVSDGLTTVSIQVDITVTAP
ncbi:MAG: Ig-like domain-containing protein, partial [Myxococcota bacterium]